MLITIKGYSTNNLLDSLKQELNTSKTDSAKANAYIVIGDYWLDNNKIAKALEQYHLAVSNASKSNFYKGKAVAYNNIGYVYYLEGNYEKAIGFMQNAYEEHEKDLNKKEMAITLNNMAQIYNVLGKSKKYIKKLFESIRLFEEIGDYDDLCTIYNNLASFYYETDDLDKALKYFKIALDYASKAKVDKLQAKTYGNIGMVYDAKKNIKEAKKYFQYSYEINLKNNDEIALIEDYIRLGEAEISLKQDEKAILNLNKAIELAIKNKITNSMGSAFLSLGDLYMIRKNYPLAELNLSKAEKYISSYDDEVRLVSDLYKLYAVTGRTDKALHYTERLMALKDSVYNESTTQIMQEMATKYETDKKEKQNQILKQENELSELKLEQSESENQKKNFIIIIVAIGIALVLSMTVLLYRQNRLKQKSNIQLSLAYTIIEEKNKDITDSIEYAKRLQLSILPEIEQINKSIPENFVFFRPRDIVSGDFYVFYERDGLQFMAACDCTGHGVPGAFVSMLCSNLFYNAIMELKINDPGKILSHINKNLLAVFAKDGSSQKSNDGMDTSLVVIDKNKNEIKFAGAMNDMLVVKNQDITEVKADRMPIGGKTPSNFNFTSKVHSLSSDEKYYLFSDGFADQFGGPKGKKFLMKRFKELLLNTHAQLCHQQVSILEKELLQWQGKHERVDDILVIGFKC